MMLKNTNCAIKVNGNIFDDFEIGGGLERVWEREIAVE